MADITNPAHIASLMTASFLDPEAENPTYFLDLAEGYTKTAKESNAQLEERLRVQVASMGLVAAGLFQQAQRATSVKERLALLNLALRAQEVGLKAAELTMRAAQPPTSTARRDVPVKDPHTWLTLNPSSEHPPPKQITSDPAAMPLPEQHEREQAK